MSGIPGIRDLLKGAHTDPEKMVAACENEIQSLFSGIQAIGHLVWQACTSDDQNYFDKYQISQAAWAMSTMARHAETLHDLQGEAEYLITEGRRGKEVSAEAQPT